MRETIDFRTYLNACGTVYREILNTLPLDLFNEYYLKNTQNHLTDGIDMMDTSMLPPEIIEKLHACSVLYACSPLIPTVSPIARKRQAMQTEVVARE